MKRNLLQELLKEGEKKVRELNKDRCDYFSERVKRRFHILALLQISPITAKGLHQSINYEQLKIRKCSLRTIQNDLNFLIRKGYVSTVKTGKLPIYFLSSKLSRLLKKEKYHLEAFPSVKIERPIVVLSFLLPSKKTYEGK